MFGVLHAEDEENSITLDKPTQIPNLNSDSRSAEVFESLLTAAEDPTEQ